MGRHRLLSDEEIIRRARAIFVERGYRACTRDVAAAVGLSWPALVLRFGGKWELFRRAMVEPIRAPAAFAFPAQGTELREQLEQLHALLLEQWPMRLQYRLAASSAEHDDTDRLLDGLGAVLQAQARRGAIRSDMPAPSLARLVLALLVGAVAQRFMRCGAAGGEDRTLVDEVVHLLLPRPGDAAASHKCTEVAGTERGMELRAVDCS